MNCQDFEGNIDGLARGALMDARAREVALAHETECARCAARLADERAITSGLRALADGTKEACAPARIEAALLAALRTRAASDVVAEVAAAAKSGSVVSSESVNAKQFSENSNVRQLSENENVRRLSWTKTIAVAALAAAAALALFMLVPPGTGTPASKTKDSVAGNQTAGQEHGGAPSIAVSATTTTVTPVKEDSTPSEKGLDQRSIRATAGSEERELRAGGLRRPSSRAQAMNVGFNNGGGSQSVRAAAASATSNNEITTDFISLMQGGRLTQAEGVHMVRVELPRSALARFGLPVNAEQAEGRVKADVLLGEDGVARAIRFVR